MNDIIQVVGEAFIVICSVAVSQFFTGGTVIDQDPAFRTPDTPNQPERRSFWYILCYMLALIVLVTLVLRFIIGSHVHLMRQYPREVDLPSFRRFVTDVCFLMFFGAFLVGAAQSKSVRAFFGWLALTSGAGVLWSLIALWRGDPDLPYWWLWLNSFQLALTTALSVWCQPYNAKPGVGRTSARWGLVLAGAWFMIIFALDLQKIVLGKILLMGVSH